MHSSPMNDGAAALIFASEETVDRLGLEPMASYVARCSVGVHPDSLTGPVPATERLVSRIGWRIDDVDLIELNEAFASQSIACIDELEARPLEGERQRKCDRAGPSAGRFGRPPWPGP